ncbi:MAG: hypothetical protein K2F87_02900 [Muribaculaceae bacterium]|nr:hypothetical protein [Muribaculaceae bacterium]
MVPIGICRRLATVVICVLVTMTVYGGGLDADESNDSIFDVLRREISSTVSYRAAKEARLKVLKRDLHGSGGELNFNVAAEIFKEYAAYQSDSAFHYATMMHRDAEARDDREGLAIANAAFAEYFVSVGFFKEASEMMRLCESRHLPPGELSAFYYLNARLYQALESYVGGSGSQLWPHYHRLYEAYLDSTAGAVEKGSYKDRFISIEIEQLRHPDRSKEVADRLRLLQRYEMSDHEKAVNYSKIGRELLSMGERERSKYYFAQSAIHDIRSATNETTSAMMLAIMFHDDGDPDRAHEYMMKALDDANFFNTRLRRYEISGYLPAIDSARFNWIRGHVWRLWCVVAAILLLLIISIYQFFRLRNHKRRLEASKAEIDKKNEELRHSHSQLEDAHNKLKATLDTLQTTLGQLRETTEIKDRYIMQSLYVNTGFVNQVEERCKEVARDVKDKKYDDLKFLPYRMGIKEERERIYKSFDNAFLKLFPNFIDEFNKLFDESDRFVIDPQGDLPTEVRIFALLRLGISGPAEVASYLNLSTKTVYVYKTKIKTRSIVDNSEFEARVMAIPKP